MAAPPPYPGTTDQKGGPPPPNPAYPQQPGPAGYGAQYGQPAPYPAQQYQPAQYNTPYGQNTSTVVVTQPAYTVVQHFRESPVRIKCQFCQADVVTSTYYETGTLTWVACFVIAIVGCWLGCCLIPFCMDACKDVVHQCPNCHQQVGRYNRYPQGGYPPGPGPQQGGYPAGPGQYQGAYPSGPYPNQGQYPSPGPTQTVIVTQPTVAAFQYRETPVHTQCPHCQAEVVTATSYETGTLAWVACILLCVFGCDAGCCLIPFCCDACQDVIHTCPNCKQIIYRWNRM